MIAKEHMYAVIVAGGSGTRLWPMSRKDLPKQMQSLVSDKTLIEDTFDRLEGIVPQDQIYVSTTHNYAPDIQKLLPKVPADNFIVEPAAKGPATAFALFAEVIYQRDPEAVIFSVASDHAVSEIEKLHIAMRTSYDYVDSQPNSLALVGVKPTRPDPNLGYIKVDKRVQEEPPVYAVEKFVEKPQMSVAKKYIESGEYYWNVAYYCFRASTLVQAYEEADETMMSAVRRFIRSGRVSDFQLIPPKVHEIEIINATKFPLRIVPADFVWSDVGNWSALHSLLAGDDEASHVVRAKFEHIDVDSNGCLIMSSDDKKLITTVGLRDVVVVDTDDALLVMDKDHDQDVKALLAKIRDKGLHDYL